MAKEFVYNPEKPCIVLLNGEDVGALVAGRFYRFDSNHRGNIDTYDLIGNLFFELGETVGYLEGYTIILEKTKETFDLIEA